MFADVSVVIAASIALMMEAASTYEASVNVYQTTRRNNPEDSHLSTFKYTIPHCQWRQWRRGKRYSSTFLVLYN
jgi:hypothetical protein